MKNDLVFKGTITDIPHDPKPDFDLERQLFSDKRIKDKLDHFEKIKGVKRDPAPNIDTKIKNILLEPEREKDKILLNDLMNNKEQYSIVKWSENWTRTGQYKVFIIYEEYFKKSKPTTNDPDE